MSKTVIPCIVLREIDVRFGEGRAERDFDMNVRHSTPKCIYSDSSLSLLGQPFLRGIDRT
jgi:hypothetical protein